MGGVKTLLFLLVTYSSIGQIQNLSKNDLRLIDKTFGSYDKLIITYQDSVVLSHELEPLNVIMVKGQCDSLYTGVSLFFLARGGVIIGNYYLGREHGAWLEYKNSKLRKRTFIHNYADGTHLGSLGYRRKKTYAKTIVFPDF